MAGKNPSALSAGAAARIAVRLVARAGWAPLLVFAFHVFISRAVDVYGAHPWIDMPMHFFGGAVIAYFFFSCFAAIPDRVIAREYRQLAQAVFVISMTATAAVFWEFGEYAADTLFQTHQLGNIQDTLQDMVLGISGAAAFVLLAWLRGTLGKIRPLEIKTPGR